MRKKVFSFLGCILVLFSLTITVFAADTDVYYECVDYELTAKCELKGDVPKNFKENFIVVAKPDEQSPLFEKSQLQIPAGEVRSFGKVNADKPSVYSYVVSQNKGKNKNITYDDTKFEVVVDVITNDAGLVAEHHTITNLKSKEKVDEIRFINLYKSDSPKTGDDNQLILWIAVLVVLVVCGIVVGIVYIVNRKKEKNEE